jgi:LmeA-like phospholipid-binding
VRRLIAFLVTLAVVLTAADFGLRFLSDYWVARQVQQSLQLPTRPSVSLGGFPYIPRLVSGAFPTATVRSDAFTADQVKLERISLTLRDVRCSTRQLLYGQQAAIRAKRGDGEAILKAIDVTGTQAGTLHVRFERARVEITSDQLPGTIGASVALDGSTLVIRPNDPGLSGSFDVGLPEFLPGLRFTAVAVSSSGAEIAFKLENPTFEVNG